jgi:FkbM family methyltransferase
MKSREPPIYQTIIQKLPWRNAAAGALGRLFGPRIKAVVNRAGMRLDLREGIQQAMFLDAYEPAQTLWFKQCLAPGDIAVDVGASFGYYTTLASSIVGRAGKVFAFEPSPAASKVIEEAIADSRIQNVELVKAAVGEREGDVSLYLPTTRMLHSPSILRSDPAYAPIRIPVIALDRFEPLRNVPCIKLVKIDVEGYEPNVLDGMAGLIEARRVENIICEFNSGWLRRNATTSKQLLKRFMDFGYRIRMQTALRENLVGHHGELFDLQDIWFSIS